MLPKSPLVVGAFAFLFGVGTTGAVLTAVREPAKPGSPVTQAKDGEPADMGELRKANENLTDALQVCDHKLAELRASDRASPRASASAAEHAPEERDAGRARRRERGEPSKDDWERMAQLGTVRARIPCIRDKPYEPSARTLDRLGLSPGDDKTLKEAYAASNKRVTEQLRPLCAKVLGSDLFDKIGASGCMDAIQNSARKGDAEAMKKSLTSAAEVQAGKRAAPKPTDEVAPVERLALLLADENRAFEKDLAAKLGPDEAKRLAWAPELCAERRTLRASDDEPGEGRRGAR